MLERLTDLKISKAKPTDKPYKLTDGGGLYVIVTPKGQKWWRLDYRYLNQRKTLGLGVYPQVSLKMARERRAALREALERGEDPAVARKMDRAVQEQTLEVLVKEWVLGREKELAPDYIEKIAGRFKSYVLPWLGSRPIAAIEAADLVPIINRLVDRGAVESAHRVKQHLSLVFQYAMRKQLRKNDPTQDLRGQMPPRPQQKHFGAIVDPKQVGALMRALHGYQGRLLTRVALLLSAMTLVRPGELRKAEWAHIDLDGAEWRIPAANMKKGRMHIVPLSRQVVALLRELHPLTGSKRYVFPCERTPTRPMSENTVNGALRRLGYSGDEMTAHGFRATASTLLNEHGWNRDAIERQLAHVENNRVRAAYLHAEFLDERKKMMQAWSDYLDSQRLGGEVVRLKAV